MTQEEIWYEQAKATADALKREGKVDGDTYRWFIGKFVADKRNAAKQSRQ